jgi:hypothetical protein
MKNKQKLEKTLTAQNRGKVDEPSASGSLVDEC